jgi:hypothetical protein
MSKLRSQGMKMTRTVFFDTMVFLHYRPIHEIDLCKLVESDKVELMLPRITLAELDKHKNTHNSQRIRDRARNLLIRIEEWIECNKEIRAGVSINISPLFPGIDFAAHGLNPNWNDDVLIASILEFKSQNPNDDVVLITQDTGPRMACRHHGIETAKLGEDYRVPDDPDEVEAENRSLKRRLAKFESALPKLIVCFADSDKSIHSKFKLKKPTVVDESKIQQEVSKVRSEVPQQPPNTQSTASIERFLAGPILNIKPEEYERYNTERDKYLQRYEDYLRRTAAHLNAAERSIEFQIEIRNTGTAPADDVDVWLHFPDGFTIYDEENFPEPPPNPSPPQRPQSEIEKILTASRGFSIPRVSFPSNKPPPSSFRLERTNSYEVTDHFQRIKHGYDVKLPRFLLIFDSFESGSSFSCCYQITPANLTEPITGELHFVIEKET